jgi:hypothetical protein
METRLFAHLCIKTISLVSVAARCRRPLRAPRLQLCIRITTATTTSSPLPDLPAFSGGDLLLVGFELTCEV